LHKYEIEERRRKVTTLLAQSMNETEIAYELIMIFSTGQRDYMKKGLRNS